MIQMRFDPKPDITAYELARIMSMMLFPTAAELPLARSVRFIKADFDALAPEIARHFVPAGS